jgi:hypothetical protein
MAKYIAALALIGAVLADGGSHASHGAVADPGAYAAPSSGYGSPQQDYAAPANDYAAPAYSAPTYEQPQETYGAPAVAYESYDAPAYSAEGALDTIDGFDLSKLTELLPLFIAVFAAIIIAQIFAPLFAALFGAKASLLGSIVQPFGQGKLDIINVVLNPFNLVLGNVGTCTPAVWGKRSFSDGIDVLQMIEVGQNLYNALN